MVSVNHCGSGMKGDLASNLDRYTPSLKKLDRCLRVLENVSIADLYQSLWSLYLYRLLIYYNSQNKIYQLYVLFCEFVALWAMVTMGTAPIKFAGIIIIICII